MVAVRLKVVDNVSTGCLVDSHAFELLHSVADCLVLCRDINADCRTRKFDQ